MRPTTPEAAAALLREAAANQTRVRPRGGATKLDWGAPCTDDEVELETGGLNALVAHNAGDFTAILQAGLPLAEAQAVFATEGQMLALDPPLGDPPAATVGGVLAAADSGPLRHRYGGVRDLVVGMTVALSDGTLAKSGGTVIKNVAGYDLGKLFCGSLGTLGLIVQVAVRLHPRPEATATATGTSTDGAKLQSVLLALARSPLEADSFDVAYRGGAGRLLVRFSGAAAPEQARSVAQRLHLDDVAVIEDDEPLWTQQRAAQRSASGVSLKVSGRPAELGRVLAAARDADAAVVGRAALGLSWITLEGDHLAARVTAIREALEPRPCVLLDAPASVRAAVAAWPAADPGAAAVMQRVKARFDPARIMRPGTFVAGI
jgi:glycolate oxidase FAD binding subunit